MKEKLNLTLFGNCQILSLEKILNTICANAVIETVRVDELIISEKPSHKKMREKVHHRIKSADIFLIQNSSHAHKVIDLADKYNKEYVLYPNIIFKGFHPDCIYINDGQLKSPIGQYHSRIIASSFMVGLDMDQCHRLFAAPFYNSLGYNRIMNSSKVYMDIKFEEANISTHLLEKWMTYPNFMHSPNHPKLHILEELIREVLKNLPLSFRNLDTTKYIQDPLISAGIFPEYLDTQEEVLTVAERLFFKSKDRVLDLKEFIKESYNTYLVSEAKGFKAPELEPSQITFFDKKAKTFLAKKQEIISSRPKNPYRAKPDYCFWKKSISTIDYSEVDPVVQSDINIKISDKIATAGSCFAQHLSKRLAKSGYNYYVVEQKPELMKEAEGLKNNYGVYSARYGNVYTTNQLLQLYQRAFKIKEFDVEDWKFKGQFVDPFRPAINPNGYKTKQEMLEARNEHLTNVAEMFRKLDVFVFTLGLTEAWLHKDSGAVLPIAPGVSGGYFDKEKYEFKNFRYDDVKESLEEFITLLRTVNTSCKIILTVSPVALLATYEDRHVLVSTIASKSILRSVVDEVCGSLENVVYFPSYEIITGSFNQGKYFKEDRRSVTEEGVSHVMRLFMKHCTTGNVSIQENTDLKDLEELDNIICDLDAIESNS